MSSFNPHTFIKTHKVAKKMPLKLFFIGALSIGLAACDDSTSKTPLPTTDEVVTVTEELIQDVEQVIEDVTSEEEYSYSVTVTNLTYAQPLSPVALILSKETSLWKVGESASVALENLAESGDNSKLLALESNIATSSGDDVVVPGASATLDITTTDKEAIYFTAATMLVNTNDAFSGLTGVDISKLALNQEMTWNLNVYDSGTEGNDEAAGTVPGPAAGGVGYDSARNDVDVVAYHPGVVSQDDGLSSSALTQAHRFDNPAVKLTITRTK